MLNWHFVLQALRATIMMSESDYCPDSHQKREAIKTFCQLDRDQARRYQQRCQDTCELNLIQYTGSERLCDSRPIGCDTQRKPALCLQVIHLSTLDMSIWLSNFSRKKGE